LIIAVVDQRLKIAFQMGPAPLNAAHPPVHLGPIARHHATEGLGQKLVDCCCRTGGISSTVGPVLRRQSGSHRRRAGLASGWPTCLTPDAKNCSCIRPAIRDLFASDGSRTRQGSRVVS
jgi:hypothetical protein